MDLTKITLSEPTADLFDKVADQCAKSVSEGSIAARKEVNKSTQLRKFYDEVVMWEQRIKTSPERFSEFLPLIRMINAKVAYAKGRGLVDDNYFNLMRHCLSEVKDEKTFVNCKRFLEAFMGFYKMYQPK